MKNFIFLFIGLCFLMACRDLQEKDIRKDNIELISPADSARSQLLSQTFFWNKLDGASAYRLQITYNNFNTISLLLDSTIKSNQFTYSLPLADTVYQWRVMPINYGYDGMFSAPRTLRIDSGANINLQRVVLRSPASKSIVGKSMLADFKFQWNYLAGATNYALALDSGGTEILYKRQILDLEYPYNKLTEGKYTWTVQGFDGRSNSLENPSMFFVDLTPPTVTLTPSQGGRVNDTITVRWTVNDMPVFADFSGNGIKQQTLLVFYDSTENQPYQFPYPNPDVGATSSSSRLALPTKPGSLWWKIKAIDKGLNESTTKVNKIVVNEK